MYGFYLLRHANDQMHVCLIASAVKIITKRVAVVYRFKQARSQGGSVGSEEPPSQIKVHFLKNKVHLLKTKGLPFKTKGPLL